MCLLEGHRSSNSLPKNNKKRSLLLNPPRSQWWNQLFKLGVAMGCQSLSVGCCLTELYNQGDREVFGKEIVQQDF